MIQMTKINHQETTPRARRKKEKGKPWKRQYTYARTWIRLKTGRDSQKTESRLKGSGTTPEKDFCVWQSFWYRGPQSLFTWTPCWNQSRTKRRSMTCWWWINFSVHTNCWWALWKGFRWWRRAGWRTANTERKLPSSSITGCHTQITSHSFKSRSKRFRRVSRFSMVCIFTWSMSLICIYRLEKFRDWFTSEVVRYWRQWQVTKTIETSWRTCMQLSRSMKISTRKRTWRRPRA